MLTLGSLFSGIGGLELGFERTGGFVTRWQVENDPYATKVLAKHWPEVKRYGDITKLDAAELERVDVIVGGFPCQPVSLAGKQQGQDDARWLWPHYARLIRELRPRYAIMENVPGLLHRGLGQVLGELAHCGYDAEWQMLPASAFGAPHRRARLFIVAHTVSKRGAFRSVLRGPIDKTWRETRVGQFGGMDGSKAWAKAIRELCRVNDGLPSELDRLRCLGNAVVPAVAEYVAQCVLEHARSVDNAE